MNEKHKILKSLFIPLLCLLLFLISINNIYASAFSAALIFLILTISFAFKSSFFSTQISVTKEVRKKTSFILSIGILFICLSVHGILCYSYGYVNEAGPIFLILFSCLLYAIGFYLNYPVIPWYPYNTIVLILSFILGSVLFSFVSIQLNGLQVVLVNNVQGVNRSVASIWNGELFPGTLFDNYSTLGLVLLPICLFPKDKNIQKRFYFIFLIICSLIFLMSLNSVVTLQGRGPWTALAIAILFSSAISIKNNKRKALILIITTFCLVFTVFIADFHAIINIFLENGYFNRFEDESLSSGRFELWFGILGGLLKYPFGGREISIYSGNETDYAHNIFLDIAYDSGIFPMLLLILFMTLHYQYLVAIYNDISLPKIVKLFIGCVAIAYFVRFMAEPILSGSNLSSLFPVSCFFLGLITRISGEVKYNKLKPQ